jgi:hypothetical protein
MAMNHRLPHNRRLERQFPASLPDNARAMFRQGLAESYADGSVYDIILCNGLAGGRFLNSHRQISALLDNLQRLIAPNGIVLMGNHFHDGTRGGVETVMRLATESGWHLSGDWRGFLMSLSSTHSF